MISNVTRRKGPQGGGPAAPHVRLLAAKVIGVAYRDLLHFASSLHFLGRDRWQPSDGEEEKVRSVASLVAS